MKTKHLQSILFLLILVISLSGCIKLRHEVSITDYGFVQIDNGEISLHSDKYGIFIPPNSELIKTVRLAADGKRVWFYLSNYLEDKNDIYTLKQILPVDIITPLIVENINLPYTSLENAFIDCINPSISDEHINLQIDYNKNTDRKRNTFTFLMEEKPDENNCLTIRICHNNHEGDNKETHTSTYLCSIPLDNLSGYKEDETKAVQFIYQSFQEEHSYLLEIQRNIFD